MLFVLLGSCAIKKLQRPTKTEDTVTGVKVEENSIDFLNRKVCYLYTSMDTNQYINNLKFKDVLDANFFPANRWPENPSFYGSASSLKQIDTIVSDNRMALLTLEEALRGCPMNIEFMLLPQGQFSKEEGTIDTAAVLKKFGPDIIINLKSLALKLKGDANIGRTPIKSTPGDINFGTYSSITTYANYYGNILMDYTAVWEIRDVKGNSVKGIKLSGRYVSVYYENYSLQDEILICSQKIGREFASLIKGNTSNNLK
jgi:hypothetical protein